MHRLQAAGALVSVLALAGYVAGTVVAYPGRSLSLTLVMAGLTLVAIGRTES